MCTDVHADPSAPASTFTNGEKGRIAAHTVYRNARQILILTVSRILALALFYFKMIVEVWRSKVL